MKTKIKTWGLFIVVVLLAGIALYSLGVFSPEVRNPQFEENATNIINGTAINYIDRWECNKWNATISSRSFGNFSKQFFDIPNLTTVELIIDENFADTIGADCSRLEKNYNLTCRLFSFTDSEDNRASFHITDIKNMSNWALIFIDKNDCLKWVRVREVIR